MKAVLSILHPAAVADRLARRSTLTPQGCWDTTYCLDRWGYGKVKVHDAATGERRTIGTHRAAWLAHRGDIPAGLVTDHLCRNRRCCNPWHMELVTAQVNSIRADHSGKAGRSGTRPGKQIFSCGKHGRSDGYLFTNSLGYQTWTCRPCRRARVNAWRARRAAASAQIESAA